MKVKENNDKFYQQYPSTSESYMIKTLQVHDMDNIDLSLKNIERTKLYRQRQYQNGYRTRPNDFEVMMISVD